MNKKHFVLLPEQRPEALDVVGTEVTILASSTETECYGLTFQKGEEDTGPPVHSHNWDEAFYVLSGEVHFQCAGEQYKCTTGTLVHIPRNTEHGFKYGSGGGTMIEITSRDSTAAEMFTAFDSEIDADTDIPETIAFLKRNGVTVAT